MVPAQLVMTSVAQIALVHLHTANQHKSYQSTCNNQSAHYQHQILKPLFAEMSQLHNILT